MEQLKDYLDPSWKSVFEINGFSERMGPIRQKVRPGLIKLAGRLAEIMGERGLKVYPHVASHMRRRVNPPNETWLALGPEKRGYKAWGHLGVFIGKGGCSVRFVVKDEAEAPKKSLGSWLEKESEARKWFNDHPDLLDFDVFHGSGLPGPVLERSPREIGIRLRQIKSSGLDIGWGIPFETGLDSLTDRIWSLSPLYRVSNGS